MPGKSPAAKREKMRKNKGTVLWTNAVNTMGSMASGTMAVFIYQQRHNVAHGDFNSLGQLQSKVQIINDGTKWSASIHDILDGLDYDHHHK
ncbi:hypothetical protein DFP92_12810 [Yoonia sediminilitoris]|uniref:Uncharacterized protein n=1 Tax=Yoonia sediminilitoris TaxID=1286148 RepID=A0A2T6K4K7_9RHOB|nr:hypothetical protein C8N45_12810 [Yoonia sediminilitoris]RCW89515.1 hypothetical protein DFP92_12810 [Yoonia sediminilitoris]